MMLLPDDRLTQLTWMAGMCRRFHAAKSGSRLVNLSALISLACAFGDFASAAPGSRPPVALDQAVEAYKGSVFTLDFPAQGSSGTCFLVSSLGMPGVNPMRYFLASNRHVLAHFDTRAILHMPQRDAKTGRPRAELFDVVLSRSYNQIHYPESDLDLALMDFTKSVPALERHGVFIKPVAYADMAAANAWKPVHQEPVAAVAFRIPELDRPTRRPHVIRGSYMASVPRRDAPPLHLESSAHWLSDLQAAKGNSGSPVFGAIASRPVLVGVLRAIVGPENRPWLVGRYANMVYAHELRHLLERAVKAPRPR